MVGVPLIPGSKDTAARINPEIRCAEFIHLGLHLMRSKGDLQMAAVQAEEAGQVRVAHVLRSAVTAGGLSSSTWAGAIADYQFMVDGFLNSLVNAGAFDTLLPFTKQLPLRTKAGAVTVGASGSVVGVGMVTPISSLTLVGNQLEAHKCSVVVAISQELARAPGQAGTDFFARELTN